MLLLYLIAAGNAVYVWIALKDMFVNFFSGEEQFKNIQLFDKDKEVLELIFSEYFRFYELINKAWSYLDLEIYKEFNIKFKKPGDLFAYIISTEAKVYCENNTNRQTLYRACKAYEVSKDNPSKQTLTYLNRIKKQNCLPNYNVEKTFYIKSFCIAIIKNKSDKAIKTYMKNYEISRSALYDYQMSALRTSF